jgi:hypothetical protein
MHGICCSASTQLGLESLQAGLPGSQQVPAVLQWLHLNQDELAQVLARPHQGKHTSAAILCVGQYV